MNATDDELQDYLNGMFNPMPVPTFKTSAFVGIAQDKALLPIWRDLNTPALALIASLYLLGLARHLDKSKLRTALLSRGEGHLHVVLRQGTGEDQC